MNRTVIAISLVAALFGGLALVFVWYMSFGLGRPAFGEIQFSEMRAPATLSYREDGMVSIRADTEADAYRALGYRTGRDHGWTSTLLRQTATGRLSEWFGTPTRQLDRFALTMGFGRAAHEAARTLSPEDRRVLDAFSEGLTEALNEEGVALGNEFVLFDIDPEPWEAWHSLSIERMLAWLTEPPLQAIPGDTLFWPIRRHEDLDRTFRTWLHLHGADMSASWAWADSTGWNARARMVYGATALPLFSPVSIEWSNTVLSGSMLIGTPFLPVMSGPSGLRIVLLSSGRRIELIEEVTADDPELESRFERIVEHSGDEHLVESESYGSRLLLSQPDAADSLFSATTLAWSGISGPSDWPVWRELANRIGAGLPIENNPPRFQLLDGDGLIVTADGADVVGDPEVSERRAQRVFIGNNSVGSYAADRVIARDTDLRNLRGEDISEWGRVNAPRAVQELGSDSTFGEQLKEAVAYLRNWDSRYQVSSIGASLFDSWMLHYRSRRGVYPVIEIPTDSLARDSVRSRLVTTLRMAVDSLTDIGGRDLARWRLESFRPGRRYFPVWSYPGLEETLPALNQARYAPIEIAQPGHPTTLRWQPGIDDEPANSPSHVLVGGPVGQPRRLVFRPDYEMGSGFIARYIAGPPSEDRTQDVRVIDQVVLTP